MNIVENLENTGKYKEKKTPVISLTRTNRFYILVYFHPVFFTFLFTLTIRQKNMSLYN